MRVQEILQASKFFLLLIFIIIDLFGMFHGLSATMPFNSNNANVMAIRIYGYSMLFISIIGFFKLLDCAKKIRGFVSVVLVLLMRTVFALFVLIILLLAIFIVIRLSSFYDIIYLTAVIASSLLWCIRSFISRKEINF
jgi:hypothetical protein